MPKFKHTVSNYLKLPVVILINPVVYLAINVLTFATYCMNYIFDKLPSLELDWTDDAVIFEAEVKYRLFKNVNKEN